MQTKTKSGNWKWVFWLLIVPIGAFVIYTWFVLAWSYSEGERAGYVQKLSKRGWLCKTWEGELALVTMPGTVAEKFFFTVRDEAIAKKINQTIGQRVALEYDQHIGIPSSCFGDTQYFIREVRVVADVSPVGAPLPAPAGTPPAAPAPAPAGEPAEGAGPATAPGSTPEGTSPPAGPGR